MEILLYILLTLMLAAVAMLTVMLVRQSKAEERIVDRLMEELEDGYYADIMLSPYEAVYYYVNETEPGQQLQ